MDTHQKIIKSYIKKYEKIHQQILKSVIPKNDILHPKTLKFALKHNKLYIKISKIFRTKSVIHILSQNINYYFENDISLAKTLLIVVKST